MTSSTPRIKLRDRLDRIDLSHVTLIEIEPYLRSISAYFVKIQNKSIQNIIHNVLLGTVNAFLDGFEVPFTDIPKLIGHVNAITEGVLKYRLWKGV